MPTISEQKLRGRLDYIDILRAVAALAVFLVHIWAYWLGGSTAIYRGHTPRAILFRAMSLGSAGVDLFIVISGFCLAYPLFKGTPRVAAPRPLRAKRFYKRRAFRILPAYYIALSLFFCIELYRPAQKLLVYSPVTAWDYIAHVFLVQTWFNSTLSSINGPFWSIALEAQLYVVFPALVVAIRRWGFGPVLAALAALAVISNVVGHFWTRTHLGATFMPDLDFELPARWIEFGLGVYAARIVTAPRATDFRLGLAAFLGGIPVALIAEAVSSDAGRALGWGSLSFGLVVLLSFAPHRALGGNIIGRSLGRMGVVSYSFYLLHQPIMLGLTPLEKRLHLGPLATTGVGVSAGLAVILVCAAVFFRLAEKPFLVRGGMRDAVNYDAPVTLSRGRALPTHLKCPTPEMAPS